MNSKIGRTQIGDLQMKEQYCPFYKVTKRAVRSQSIHNEPRFRNLIPGIEITHLTRIRWFRKAREPCTRMAASISLFTTR